MINFNGGAVFRYRIVFASTSKKKGIRVVMELFPIKCNKWRKNPKRFRERRMDGVQSNLRMNSLAFIVRTNGQMFATNSGGVS